jgi:hypothetical protein
VCSASAAQYDSGACLFACLFFPKKYQFIDRIKLVGEECGRSILIQILMKQMNNEVNFRRKCGNTGNSTYLRGKIDDFCQTLAFCVIITKTQMQSHSLIYYTL